MKDWISLRDPCAKGNDCKYIAYLRRMSVSMERAVLKVWERLPLTLQGQYFYWAAVLASHGAMHEIKEMMNICESCMENEKNAEGSSS